MTRALASVAAASLSLCVLAPRTAAAVPKPKDAPDATGSERRHAGLYVDFDLGGGGFFLSSNASASNGFRQPIPSTARGGAFPSLSAAVGGTLPHTSIVLGVRLSRAETSEPTLHTLDHGFRLPQYRLAYTDCSLFGRYYPDPYGGLHFGAALGVLGLAAQTSADAFSDQNLPESEDQMGMSFSPEAGQSFWLRNKISAGVVVRAMVARTWGREGASTLFVPAVLASLSWN